MSATNYPDTMTIARPPEQPRPEFGIRWWIIMISVSGASAYVFGAAHRTGNWVLIGAMWAALLTYVIVSYRSFAKRERRRRAAESDAAAKV